MQATDAPVISLAAGAPFIVLYSVPGTGKTLQMIRTFWYGCFIGQNGAAKPAIGACGFDQPGLTGYPLLPPDGYHPDTLMDLNAWIGRIADWAVANGVPFPYSAFLLDDWHNICANTNTVLEASAPKGNSGNRNEFWVIREYNTQLDLFYRTCKTLGVPVVINVHQRPPDFKSGIRMKQGGPLVSNRTHARSLIGQADMVLHAVADPDSRDPLCPVAYEVNPMGMEDDYPTKDRHPVSQLRKLPPSLREILLACEGYGYERYLPRPPGLAWIDELRDRMVAQFHAGNGSVTALRSECIEQYKLPMAQVDWAISDAVARYQIQKGFERLRTRTFDIQLSTGSATATGSVSLPSLPLPPPRG